MKRFSWVPRIATRDDTCRCYNPRMNLQICSIVRNEDVDGPRSIVSYNPATEEEIATVSALDGDGAADAVAAAKEAFPEWSKTRVKERQKILARWLEIMLEERDDLAKLVSMEGGKPANEARLVDVFPGLESLSYYSKYIDRMLAFREVKPNQILFRHWRAGYRFDPLGVIGVITPWNYPVTIPMGEIVPAVGAGNTVVFKPASATTLIGLKLGDMARRAGLPPGVLNTVALPGSATDALLDHPDVAKVLFTGSVEVGRHVGRRCAERIAPAQLELGGKDAAVVAADADIERTARGLVWAAFVNTGQTCASVERVYVERPIFDRLLKRIVELTNEIKVGDPNLPDTDMGPLTTKGQLDIVARQVNEALDGGARALTGGERPAGRFSRRRDSASQRLVLWPDRLRVDQIEDRLRVDQIEEEGGPSATRARRGNGDNQRSSRHRGRSHRLVGGSPRQWYRQDPRSVRALQHGQHQIRDARPGRRQGHALVLPL
jgi:succinate-semialdehyde dehydrogenase/glutarate-semialdehyde dehydrogenase